jgi:hypothetical protein
MYISLVGPGGSEWSQPPNMKAFVPTTVRECPDRRLGMSPVQVG